MVWCGRTIMNSSCYSSAHEALESLMLMDGIVDTYMPDFKYWSAERGRSLNGL